MNSSKAYFVGEPGGKTRYREAYGIRRGRSILTKVLYCVIDTGGPRTSSIARLIFFDGAILLQQLLRYSYEDLYIS